MAITYDTGKVCLYLNGQPVGQADLADADAAAAAALRIGAQTDGPSFWGDICDIRIWSVARDREALRQLYRPAAHRPRKQPGRVLRRARRRRNRPGRKSKTSRPRTWPRSLKRGSQPPGRAFTPPRDLVLKVGPRGGQYNRRRGARRRAARAGGAGGGRKSASASAAARRQWFVFRLLEQLFALSERQLAAVAFGLAFGAVLAYSFLLRYFHQLMLAFIDFYLETLEESADREKAESEFSSWDARIERWA